MFSRYPHFLSCLILLTTILLAGALPAQADLSASDWREDLRFLQKTIHEEYPFLFVKTTPASFDREVEKLYAAIPALEPHEIVVGLARLVASFEYGHTSLRLGDAKNNFHSLPLNLYHFNDGVFVEGIHRDYERALGARVLEVAGKPIAEVLQAIRPVIPAENDQFAKGYGLGYLNFTEVLHAQGITGSLQHDITFTLEKEGRVFTETISARQGLEMPEQYGFLQPEGDWLSMRQEGTLPHYLQQLDKHYYFKYLPEEKTVYVRYSQVVPDPAESIPDFYQRVFDFVENNEVARFVLDVRLNGGGNNFNNKTVVKGIIRAQKIDQVGKLFVILGRNTFSAAQNLVSELDNYTNAIFVGEPTSENLNFYGDNRPVTLPKSQLTARLSWAWWQDKPQWQGGKWLAPHVAVDLSSNDYRTNQDPVLAAALDFEADGFILDPMDHLTQLFQNGQLEQVQQEAMRLAADPAYRFYDFEGRMNKLGDMLLKSNQLQPAMFLAQLATKLFPTSATSHDLLAEALLRSGEKTKAAALSEQVIKLDPEGAEGARARERLAKLKKE